MNVQAFLRRAPWYIAAVAVVALIAVATTNAAQDDPPEKTTTAVENLRDFSDGFADVAETVSPAVVFITAEKKMEESAMQRFGLPPGLDLFERFFGEDGLSEEQEEQLRERFQRRAPRARGQGSGFVISEDGIIVTNHHVAGEADEVNVTLADGRTLDAEVVGTDPQTDIAVIKIDADNLPVAKLGSSQDMRVGEWVVALGSPFGLAQSVTAGIISAKGRGNVPVGGQDFFADFIQTDAAINPGNSGGPLVNLNGEVIGVNTAIVSRTGGSMGIGFAVPIDMATFVIDQLRDKGSVTRSYLGAWIQDLTPELSQHFGEPDGVLIGDIIPDSPAERAGLQSGDLVIEFEGRPVRDAGSFRSRIASTGVGEEVDLTVVRDGKRMEKTLTLAERPTELASAPEAAQPEEAEATKTELGISVQNLTEELAEQFGLTGQRGVLVSEVQPGSPAARVGLEPGVLIKKVNGKDVTTVKAFQNAVQKAKRDKDSVLLLVNDGQASRFVAIEFE